MPHEFQIRTVNAQLLAAASGRGNASNFIKQLFLLLDEVWKFLRANPQIKNEGLNVFLYYGEPGQDLLNSEQGMPIAAGVKIVAPFEGGGPVSCQITPSGTVATVVHTGSYEKLPQVHAELRAWCQANGHHLAGPNWEIYGHWNADPEKQQTDVFYLLAPPATS